MLASKVVNTCNIPRKCFDDAFLGLDYDSGQKIYTLQFDLIDAQDRFGRNKTMPGTLLVSVNDLPDKPPLWTSPCFFNTFKEEMPGDLYTDDLLNSI